MSSSLTRLLAVSVPLFGVAALSYQIIPASMFSGSNPVTSYDTAEVGIGSIHRVVATSGPVRPWVTVQIGSQLSGQIRRVLADFNSEVNDGDIVAELARQIASSKHSRHC